MTFKLKDTTITIEEDTEEIITSRILHSKPRKLIVKLDGTLEDFLSKCVRTSSLPNELYEEFSELSKSI